MNYEVTITESSKELNARDRIRVKDFSNAVSLDDATQSGPVLISYDYHVLCHVHNSKSDNPEYDKCVVVDPSGTKYVTGSAAFIRSLKDILTECEGEIEPGEIVIECYRKPSKNYKGKDFITCSLA